MAAPSQPLVYTKLPSSPQARHQYFTTGCATVQESPGAASASYVDLSLSMVKGYNSICILPSSAGDSQFPPAPVCANLLLNLRCVILRRVYLAEANVASSPNCCAARPAAHPNHISTLKTRMCQCVDVSVGRIAAFLIRGRDDKCGDAFARAAQSGNAVMLKRRIAHLMPTRSANGSWVA
jgi:hypothetical protein